MGTGSALLVIYGAGQLLTKTLFPVQTRTLWHFVSPLQIALVFSSASSTCGTTPKIDVVPAATCLLCLEVSLLVRLGIAQVWSITSPKSNLQAREKITARLEKPVTLYLWDKRQGGLSKAASSQWKPIELLYRYQAYRQEEHWTDKNKWNEMTKKG